MFTSLRRQVHVAIPSYEGSAEEVGSVERDYELRPTCEIVCLKGDLKREVPGDFLAIGGCDLTNEGLFA